MSNVQLIHGDCLEKMKDIPDGSIDMILCDLPYGTTYNSWDCIIPLKEIWNQYNRVIKENGCIALFAQTPFDKVLGCSNIDHLKYEWIWVKEKSTGFFNAKKMPLKSHENILIFYKKLPVYNPQKFQGKPYNAGLLSSGNGKGTYQGTTKKNNHINETGERFPNSVLYFISAYNEAKQTGSLHPTQKPIALLEYLIKTYTLENETVLDNCMGSGSTGIACLNTNRNFIGIEKEKDYFEISKKRVDDWEKEKNWIFG